MSKRKGRGAKSKKKAVRCGVRVKQKGEAQRGSKKKGKVWWRAKERLKVRSESTRK